MPKHHLFQGLSLHYPLELCCHLLAATKFGEFRQNFHRVYIGIPLCHKFLIIVDFLSIHIFLVYPYVVVAEADVVPANLVAVLDALASIGIYRILNPVDVSS